MSYISEVREHRGLLFEVYRHPTGETRGNAAVCVPDADMATRTMAVDFARTLDVEQVVLWVGDAVACTLAVR